MAENNISKKLLQICLCTEAWKKLWEVFLSKMLVVVASKCGIILNFHLCPL